MRVSWMMWGAAFLMPLLLIGGGCVSPSTTNIVENPSPVVQPVPTKKIMPTLSNPGKLPAEEIENKQLRIATAKGDIVLKLYPDVAPLHVSSMIYLAKNGFYDGLTFHRREEGFVIQGGDPAGDGTGGPGYSVPAEFNKIHHKRGILSMARAMDPNSAGSQFFITLADAGFLDNNYTVFGEVISGMEVVDKIQVGDIMTKVTVEDAK